MASLTASLERSLQNCSLNQSHGDNHDNNNGGGCGGGGLDMGLSAATSDTPENLSLLQTNITTTNNNNNNSSLELNSHVSLPYQWEQCLDLKTGEIYYINWMNGTKVKEDPRNFTTADYFTEEDSSYYDSEGSSSESSPSSSSRDTYRSDLQSHDEVLVVAGCKSCLMYFMLPKRVEECPKCNALLLHFDRSDENGSSSP